METYQQALEVMAATPTMLRSLVAAAPGETLATPAAPEAWSPLQVLGHLLYVETVVIGPRVRLMLSEVDPAFPATPPMPEPVDAETVIREWSSARASNLELLRTLSGEQLERAGRHAKYGRITVREHVIEWAYHDLDHLRQILAAFQVPLYPHIGGFQALYPPPPA